MADFITDWSKSDIRAEIRFLRILRAILEQKFKTKLPQIMAMMS